MLIRQLARPGIVALQDDSGQPAYALLTGLGAQSATLRMNGVTQTISLLSLAGLWRGEFATLWRAPPGYAEGRLSLESAAGAEWLATRLAALDGDAPNVRSAVTPLKTRLQTFQVAQGLKPDGVAGPVTLMLLNRAGGVVEPRLPATESDHVLHPRRPAQGRRRPRARHGARHPCASCAATARRGQPHAWRAVSVALGLDRCGRAGADGRSVVGAGRARSVA